MIAAHLARLYHSRRIGVAVLPLKDMSEHNEQSPSHVISSTLAPPSGGGSAELPKQYRPSEHESGVWDSWMSARAFHADPERVLSGERKPYCVLIPPPNVTAALHLGHALNNTLQDVLVRTHRMRGYETLWMAGTDHAGIATQAVVEKRLMKEEKKRRTDFTREAFIAKTQSFKDEYEAIITNQLKKMGCSCDWDRQRFTMDDICIAAVSEAFFRLFSDGVIYRGKRLVNWDPALATAVADDECYDEEVAGAFYYLRYPLVVSGQTGEGTREVPWSTLAQRGYPGAGQFPAAEPAFITVATTRPETYLADTAVALSPHDPRASALRGLHVRLPLVGRVIPIIEDSYVVLPEAYSRSEEEKNDPKAKFATGFLKVTPAHDANDYEIGRRHGLAMINMMSPEGRVSDKHGWVDIGEATVLVGKKMSEARKEVVAIFKQLNLLEAVKPYSHSVKHSDRSKAVIEPYLSDQWYVRVTDARLAQAANRALVPDQRRNKSDTADPTPSRDGAMQFFPSRYAATFELWHDNIRDWCISRQLWWGHRIAVWQHEQTPTGQMSEQLGAWQAAGRVSIRSSGSVQGSEDTRTYCAVRDPDKQDVAIVGLLEAAGFVQDNDVLDTWFSSALWPMSTMGWPNPDERTRGLLEAFNPSDALCTAREIITLWVSRMTMFNRYFIDNLDDAPAGKGLVPFRHVFIHAVIQDGEGRKMSKSLGNGVDPLDIIESHGCDAMRYTLCNMATNTQDVRLPVAKDNATGKNSSPKFDAGRNFANKIWNAARFTLGLVTSPGEHRTAKATADSFEIDPAEDLPSAWMFARLSRAIVRIDAALASYEFSEYTQALYDIVWRDFCDWYVEAVKPTIASNAAQRDALVNILSAILRLLHPVMPFLTEAVWKSVGQLPARSIKGLQLAPSRNQNLLCLAGWPTLDAGHLASAAAAPGKPEQDFARLQRIATALREGRAARGVNPKRKITLHVSAGERGFVEANRGIFTAVCNLANITAEPAPADGIDLTIDGSLFALSDLHEPATASDEATAADAGDAERNLFVKRMAELAKEMKTYQGRLDSPGYANKAPPSMVRETQEKLEKASAEHAALALKLR